MKQGTMNGDCCQSPALFNVYPTILFNYGGGCVCNILVRKRWVLGGGEEEEEEE